jgi:acyl carrier protein
MAGIASTYELGTESNRTLRGIFGIDSMQALELTMKIIKVEIEYWEKFLADEEGAAI